MKKKVTELICPEGSPSFTNEASRAFMSVFVNQEKFVVTDCFSSYKEPSTLGYHHYTVSHKRHFVSSDTCAHTQRCVSALGFCKSDVVKIRNVTGIVARYPFNDYPYNNHLLMNDLPFRLASQNLPKDNQK